MIPSLKIDKLQSPRLLTQDDGFSEIGGRYLANYLPPCIL
jgi:hypothetical protein